MNVKKHKRKILIIVISLSAVLFCFLLITRMPFLGFFDETYTVEELTEKFNRHEIDFQKIGECFQTAVSSFECDDIYQISFGLRKQQSRSNRFISEKF